MKIIDSPRERLAIFLAGAVMASVLLSIPNWTVTAWAAGLQRNVTDLDPDYDSVKAGVVDAGTINATTVVNSPLGTIDVVKAGIVDGGTIVATVVVNSPLVTATTLDAGTVSASTYSSYAASGGLGVIFPTGVYFCLNGVTCTKWFRYDGTNITFSGATTFDSSVSVAGSGMKVGTAGTFFSASTSFSATLDFADIAPAACEDLTITTTATGTSSTTTMNVPAAAMVTGSVFIHWTTANTTTVRHCCVGSANCNPLSGAFIIRSFNP